MPRRHPGRCSAAQEAAPLTSVRFRGASDVQQALSRAQLSARLQPDVDLIAGAPLLPRRPSPCSRPRRLLLGEDVAHGAGFLASVDGLAIVLPRGCAGQPPLPRGRTPLQPPARTSLPLCCRTAALA
jgi:hypothetical protein